MGFCTEAGELRKQGTAWLICLAGRILGTSWNRLAVLGGSGPRDPACTLTDIEILVG